MGWRRFGKPQELRPDLILLDIGLPTMNGIEAARRIREISAASKIFFVSENRSADIVREALSTGAGGYVVKSDAARELLPAINAVLEGKRFVSASLADYGLTSTPNQPTFDHPQSDSLVTFTRPQNIGIIGQHEVGFYSEDRLFLDHVARFIAAALKAGNAAIVVATEAHREGLLLELQAEGFDMPAAIAEGRYIPLDAAETLSMYMVNDIPDPARFLELVSGLVLKAQEAANGEHPRVCIFGEGVHLLWAQGNADAAIQVETLCNEPAKTHGVDILCGYSLGIVGSRMASHTFERICAEHSAVHSL